MDREGGIGEEVLVMHCRVGRMRKRHNVIFWHLLGGTEKIMKSIVNTNILHYC
jgi:hypothetical protein